MARATGYVIDVKLMVLVAEEGIQAAGGPMGTTG